MKFATIFVALSLAGIGSAQFPSNVIGDISNFFSNSKSKVQQTVPKIANTVGNTVGDAVSTAGIAVKNTANTVGDAVGGAASTVGNAVASTANYVGDYVAETATTVGKTVGNAAGSTIQKASQIVQQTKSTASSAVDGAKNMMNQFKNSVSDTVSPKPQIVVPQPQPKPSIPSQPKPAQPIKPVEPVKPVQTPKPIQPTPTPVQPIINSSQQAVPQQGPKPMLRVCNCHQNAPANHVHIMPAGNMNQNMMNRGPYQVTVQAGFLNQGQSQMQNPIIVQGQNLRTQDNINIERYPLRKMGNINEEELLKGVFNLATQNRQNVRQEQASKQIQSVTE